VSFQQCCAALIAESTLGLWRQGHVPSEEYNRGERKYSRHPSFVRRAADLAVSAVCLGIPLLFVDRSRPQHSDLGSGSRNTRSTAGSMFVIGESDISDVYCALAHLGAGAVACMIVSYSRSR
jgi:hypothetical protein